MHYLLVNALLLLMAYFGAVALWQGRRIHARLAAIPFEQPPSTRSLALYLADVLLANLTGWLIYPRFVGHVKPELGTFWQLLFDYGHEHLGWYALALAGALAGAGLWAGPPLWDDAGHRRVGRALVRINGFLLLFIMAGGLAVFLVKRLVGD